MNKLKKIAGKDVEDIYALTSMQEGMLFHYLKDPKSDYYFEQLSVTITGEIDFNCFKQAWNFVIETNEMLRTVFHWEKMKNPVQVVLKEHPLEPQYYDLSNKRIGETQELLEEIKTKDREERFYLRNVPFRVTLCKIDEDKYEMLVSNHHILYDGWSTGIILKEFFSGYNHLLQQKFPVKPPKSKYKEYIRWIQSRDVEKQEKYWSSRLEGFESGTELSIKRKDAKGKNQYKHYNLKVSKAVRDKCDTLVKTHKITLACLFYGAWGLLLQRYNNSEDVVFGTTVSGRSAGVKGIEDMVGLFINTVPLRIQTANGAHETTADFLYRVNKALQEREPYETTSLVKISETFDNIVVIENYPLERVLVEGNGCGGLSVDSYSMVEKTHYDLTLGITLFEDIEISFIYNERMFDNGSIINMSRHFRKIILDIVNDPGIEISDIEIITEEEKNKILYDFNNTGAVYPLDKTIHQLFEEQAAGTPDNIAVIGTMQLTYRQLNKKSNQLALLLTKKGIKPDSIIGLMVERSLEMIFGILGILKAGGAYLPIDPEYPEERISYMLADSGAGVLLSKGSKVSRDIEVIDLAKIIGPIGPIGPILFGSPAQLCYIIYTSGTTGRPKGVMVEQGSLVNTIYWRKQEYKLGTNDKVLQLFSFSFDGFITSFFTPIVSGSAVVVLTDEESRDIFRIKEVIVSGRINHFICVPSLYASLLELCSAGELKDLRMVTLAGEPLKPAIVEKSKNLNPQLEVINEYGATENTVVATICRDIRPGLLPGRAPIIPIGKPVANKKIVILDPNDHIVPVGIPGQLCIAGKGLARGYLNRPGLTAEKFVPSSLFHFSLYRTGDLGRWLEDGNIEFLGRIDHQVKIRGFRVELGEIENQLLNHEDIKEAVVIDREDQNHQEYLCAYIVARSMEHGAWSVNREELREFLAHTLPGYMVPAHFVFLTEIPLTVTGKVDRKSLPQPEITSLKKYMAPRNEVEKKLVEIWTEILNINVGIDDHFFELGGHSLKAMALVSRIHKTFNVKVSLSEVFQLATIRKLAQYIHGAANDPYASIETAKEKQYYALSSAQKRLYILHQVDETSTRYNMSTAMRIQGALDKNKLEDTFKQLIQRHESFRTSFEMKGSEPVQIIHQNAAFALEYFHLVDIVEEQVVKNFFKGFDLSKAPLLRAGLVKRAEKEYILMVDMHHIISDEISVKILEQEFRAFYAGEELPMLGLQYKDFSEWQNRLMDSPWIKKQEEYWLDQYKDDIPVLDLPLDYPRPAVGNYEGSRICFEIDREKTAGLKRLVLETETTMFILLLAAYNVLLSKYSGQEDIVVGSPIAGRRHLDLKNIIGLFANMLAIRNRPSREKTFAAFLQEVKVQALNAYENQEYQFEMLVWKLKLKADSGRNPLFDAAFVLRNAAAKEIEMNKSKVLPYEIEQEKVHNELILVVTEGKNKLSMALDYSTELFKEATAWKISKHCIEILEQILEHRDIHLEDIRISHGFAAAEPDVIREDESDFRL